MKRNTKSSITLPAQELALVEELMKRLRSKTKVDVIRRGLKLLKETTDRSALRNAYLTAAEALRTPTQLELQELDPLADDGID